MRNQEVSNSLRQFIALFPSETDGEEQQLTRTDIAKIVNIYEDDLPSEIATDLELRAWGLKWKGTKKAQSAKLS